MAKRRRSRVMPDVFKEEYAQELGVQDVVKTNGWGELTSRQCGNMVKRAIEKYNQQNNQYK